MAHSNRNKQREKRKIQKAARKAAQQALWDAVKGTAKNKKRKLANRGVGGVRFARVLETVMDRINGRLVAVQRMVHGGPKCGNVGCKRCSSLWQVA